MTQYSPLTQKYWSCCSYSDTNMRSHLHIEVNDLFTQETHFGVKRNKVISQYPCSFQICCNPGSRHHQKADGNPKWHHCRPYLFDVHELDTMSFTEIVVRLKTVIPTLTELVIQLLTTYNEKVNLFSFV